MSMSKDKKEEITMMLKDLELVLYHIRVNHYYCDADDLMVSLYNGYYGVVIHIVNRKTHESREFDYTDTLQEILDLQSENA